TNGSCWPGARRWRAGGRTSQRSRWPSTCCALPQASKPRTAPSWATMPLPAGGTARCSSTGAARWRCSTSWGSSQLPKPRSSTIVSSTLRRQRTISLSRRTPDVRRLGVYRYEGAEELFTRTSSNSHRPCVRLELRGARGVMDEERAVPTIAGHMADFALGVTPDGIPPAVLAQAARLVADTLACGVGAVDGEAPRILRTEALHRARHAESTLLGTGERVDA